MRTYAFIDASNLFYGGEKSLGWRIDYLKLKQYLEERYQVSKVYYFGGVEIHQYPFDYLKNETVPIKEVEKYIIQYIENKKQYLTDAKLVLLDRHLRRIHFYHKLEKFGYDLVLKPVKSYEDENGNIERKANCDVDMTVYMMKERNAFDRAIFLSGDGDFLTVLKFLKENKKDIMVLARAPRTAREIKKFAGDKFMDFEYLRELLKYEE